MKNARLRLITALLNETSDDWETGKIYLNMFGVVSNQFGFHLGGLPGQVIVLESSTDLLHWLPLQTNTLGTSPLYYSEPWSWLIPQRFYRARLGP